MKRIFFRVKPLPLILMMVMFFASGTSVVAQQSEGRDDTDTIKRLLKRVEQLEARIQQLESKQSQTASSEKADKVAAKREDEAPQIDAHGDSHDAMQAGSPALQIHGFSDINYKASDRKGSTNSFLVGQIDLFVTSRLSERFSVLGELVLEANEENEFGFEAERLLIQYSQSDYFKVAVGRYHTSIGYYNTAFHHGSWFQTATERPFIFAFEDHGGFLPIHNVGLSATGLVPSGKLGLHYVAEIGNGRAHRTPLSEAVQTAVDENNGKAFNLGAYARPEWLPGLQAGFSIYRDRLTPEGLPNINETILAAHLVYQNSSLELLNEGLVVKHSPRGGGRTLNTGGFYTQVSRKFGRSRPYFRYQYVNSPAGDPIIGDIGRRNGPSFGFRYDVSEFAALKAQYDRTARRNLEAINGVTLQLAFTF
jgi:outer membrane murein-binding lipoprotein Lpp